MQTNVNILNEWKGISCKIITERGRHLSAEGSSGKGIAERGWDFIWQ